MSPRQSRGLTLIELMIALVIVAILVSLALPGYQDYVRRSQRADAASFLSLVAARQQHYLTDRRAYADSIIGASASNGLAIPIPANVSKSYTVAMVTDNAARPPVFTVTATPKGAQALDSCGALTIDQRGIKTATGTGSCW